MQRPEKEKIVAELTERLRGSETMIVADYRGLSVKEIDELRTKLLEQGAIFTVVKNSLTRRAAEAAGADTLLTLLDGPSAIAFLETGGDAVAVAKAITAEEVEELAKLPPVDILRGQVLRAVAAPLYAIIGLFTAPLQDLHGLIQARIDQLGGEAEPEAPRAEAEAEAKEEEAPEAEAPQDEPVAEAAEETTEAAEEPASEESEEE
jgi:large subunit ribosomal protein L10